MARKMFGDIDIHESLQVFLPDAPLASWYGEDTFDEDGLLHSYDDVPIMAKSVWFSNENASSILTSDAEYSSNEDRKFRWYSHGKVSRPNNLPPFVVITSDSYSTLNEHGQLQSYNDMPSNVEVNSSAGELHLGWHVKGFLHRDNLLPTSVTYGLAWCSQIESFFLKGISHRGNSLPSEVGVGTQIWTAQSTLHNSEGYAESYIDIFNELGFFVWSLYGVQMSEAFFESVKKLAADYNIPLYASFLVSMRIVTLEHLNAFMDSDSGWKTDVPVAWVLRSLNVTPEIFTEKIKGAEVWDSTLRLAWYLHSNDERFKNFMSIIDSDEKKFMDIIASEDADAAALSRGNAEGTFAVA